MKIKVIRQSRGLSQRELAEKAGISREYVWRLEQAKQDPTLGTLEKIARALRVKLTELLT